jgi:LysM repeat protein
MTTMAWSEADQNPSLAPTANSTPTYAQTLNAYAYGTSGGSSAAPSQTKAGGGRDYARQLAANAAPARKATTRALEQSAAPPAMGGYTVRRGDNLTAIGKRFGVSASEIARANGIRNPNRIGVGQQLMIPGMAEAPQVDMPNPRPRPAREVAMPTPRMRPGPRQAQIDLYRAMQERSVDGRVYNVDPQIVNPPRPAPQPQTVPQPTARWNIDGALANMDSMRRAEDAAGTRRAMESVQPAYRAPPRRPEANGIDAATRVDASGNYVLPPNVGGARPEGPAGGMPAARWQPTVAGRQEVPGRLPAARPAAPQPDLYRAMQERSVDGRVYNVDPQIVNPPRPAPQPQTVPQPTARWNIDGALANMDSMRRAEDAAGTRRAMESVQPAYRAPPRRPEANGIDAATRVDASGNYVLPPNVGGARPEGPAGGMPAARWQPTVAGRQEVPGRLPAARPAAPQPDLYRAMQERSVDGRVYYVDPQIVNPPRPAPQPQQRATPQPSPQAARRPAPAPAQVESTTGTWDDLPDPTPPGYRAQPVDPLAGRFDTFDQPAPGTIMDLRPAYESRRPTINQPPGPPVFVTPSGVRVWAAR